MAADEITTMNIRIEGRVQGCGFRDFAMREANGRKLKGWVRNRSDGSVEALAHGPTRTVEEFIAVCIKGPNGANVTSVDLQPAEPPESLGFVRRPSV
ncbi:MAG TPA: acylphosphatase [Micropepsaceae bacterium]|nr:acylphosphatase [Micropepsaceae bacterium]